MSAFINETMCIIYILRNKVNRKIYVGQTWRPLAVRFRKIYKGSPHINSAIKKYGKDAFYYDVMCFVHTQEMANYWEGYFISLYDSTNKKNGYNLRGPGGNRGKFSQESKYKMSKRKLGIPLTDEHKKHLSDAFSGAKNPAAKTNENIVKEIYLSYINDENMTISKLMELYGFSRERINSILNKKSWKKATADLPNTNVAARSKGNFWKKSNLTENDILNIRLEYITNNCSQKSLALRYNLSYTTIHEIIKYKTWKHII